MPAQAQPAAPTTPSSGVTQPQIVYVPAQQPSAPGLPGVPEFSTGVWLAILFVATIAWRMAPDILRWLASRGEEPAKKAAALEAQARQDEMKRIGERIDRLKDDLERQLRELEEKQDARERQIRADVQRSVADLMHEARPSAPRPLPPSTGGRGR